MEKMEFKSTKGMTPETAPEGKVLVKYLEPFFGGWAVEYTIAYFDNPNDYEEPNGNKGWKDWDTERRINVIAYCELPKKDLKDNPWISISQEEIKEKHGTLFPKYGCAGQ